MPKLASEQADTEEETKGAALASQQEVLFVFVKGLYSWTLFSKQGWSDAPIRAPDKPCVWRKESVYDKSEELINDILNGWLMMEKEYRLIIAGGRDFNDYDYLKESCMSIIDKLKNDNDIMYQAIRQMLCYLW